MQRGSIILLKAVTILIGIVVLALCIFFIPKLAEEAAELNPEYAYLRFPVLTGVYFTAIPFYLALYQSLKILDRIEGGNAFSKIAVISLGRIKKCAITIIFLYVIGMFLLIVQNALHPGIAIIGFVIIFATLVITLFAALLQTLLRNALELKLENDMTV